MPEARQVLLAVGALVVAAAAGTAGALVLTGGDQDAALRTAGPQASAPAAPSVQVPPGSAAPTPTPAPAPTRASSPPPASVPPLTEAVLRRAPVPSLCGHPAGRLVDGRLPGIAERAGGVELWEVALGDLDGDGVQEAAVTVGCSTGNSPSTEVLLYRTGPTLVGRVPVEDGLGSEVRQHEARVVGGRLEVSGAFQDEDDGRCCPTGVVVRQYRLRGGEVVRSSPAGVPPESRVTGDGRGPVQVGMTYTDLARVTGLPVALETLEDVPPEEASCTYVRLVGEDATGIMGGRGTVGAVVISGPGVLSRSGVGVGDTEAEVLSVYGERARRVPNEYGPVPDVVVPAGDGKIVRFEFTADRVVHMLHGGRTSSAGLVEGCA